MSDPGQQTPPPAAPSPAPREPSGAPAGSPSAPTTDPVGTPEATVEPIEIQEAPFRLLAGEETREPDAESPHPNRRRTRRILLSSLLAVGVAGAVMLGWFYWQIDSERDVTLSLPAQIGDLRLDTTQNARETSAYLETALSAEIDLDKTVGAVYSNDAEKVLVFGGTTLIWSPDRDLETSFELLTDDQGSVTGLHDVDAGTLGGSMKCGTTKTDGKDMAVCGWADHGSLALAMFANRSQAEAAPLMRQFRQAIQTRD